MITNHEFQAGEYSPRAGRRVCAICNETQGSKFHKVAPAGANCPDGSTHRLNRAGQCEWCGYVTTAGVYVSDEGDQGYSEWIDLIESQVYVNAEARVHRDFSSQSGVQGFVGTYVAGWRI